MSCQADRGREVVCWAHLTIVGVCGRVADNLIAAKPEKIRNVGKLGEEGGTHPETLRSESPATGDSPVDREAASAHPVDESTTGDTEKLPRVERFPWGEVVTLDEGPGYRVKKLTVQPGQRLEYRVHATRTEHWVVVKGTALVTLDRIPFTIKAGGTIAIPPGGAHRVENLGEGPMVFVEVQTGELLNEDSIVRIT